MATKTWARTQLHGAVLVVWETLAAGDDGQAFQPPAGYELKSMQFIGTFGGTSMTIQGTNEETPANWVADSSAVTAAGIAAPTAQMLHFRPKSTGGAGADVDAHALFMPA